MNGDLLQFFQALRGRADLPIEELVDLVARALPAVAGKPAHGKAAFVPTERTIRYYHTTGLVDRPFGYTGTRAIYGYRHVLQLLAVKALQAQDLPLRKIRERMAEAPDANLETLLRKLETGRTVGRRSPEFSETASAVEETGSPGPAPLSYTPPRERGTSTMRGQRVRNKALKERITYATDAAELIKGGYRVGMSGFTGSGYPKLVPQALAERILRAHSTGDRFRITVITGASTSSELDGALAMVDGIELRMPYNSDPIAREKINFGKMEYVDLHLGLVGQYLTSGFLGDLDMAIIEVTGITEDGKLIPSTSVGNNQAFINCAREVILEVNNYHSLEMEGMHDIRELEMPPDRKPIMIVHPGDRVGIPYLTCPPEKIRAIVETNHPDRTTKFKEPDAASRRISEHILEFFDHEVKKGRVPANLLPLQSGVGNVANAVLYGLKDSKYENLSVYTEVIQDGMMELLDAGKIAIASSTAFSLSPDWVEKFKGNVRAYRDKVILRPQSISNHAGVIKRLGVLAMNGCVEFDIYGNVNSTHVNGTRVINGIGGSGDFARNSYISIFTTSSVAAGGDISCVVPMVSHVDHCEHDVDVLVTEQGLADLRGLSPKLRSQVIIDKCVHPDYRAQVKDYHRRANLQSPGKHTPHLLEEVFSWHTRYMRTGSMKG